MIFANTKVAIAVAILAFGYICSNLLKLKDKQIREGIIFSLIFIVCIASFKWITFFQTISSAKYFSYEKENMTSFESLKENGLNIKNFFVTSNSHEVYELGLYTIIMLCFSIAAFRRLNRNYKKEYIIFLFSGILLLFMSTKFFPWNILKNTFINTNSLSFLLILINFCFAIICSINMETVINKFNLKDVIIISIICIIYTFALKSMIPLADIENVENIDIGEITGRKDEQYIGIDDGKYLPTSTNKFYIATRENNIIILEGDGTIENYKKDNGVVTAKIEAVLEKNVFELPYIYYPGYKVTLDGAQIDTFETQNGFLGIMLTATPKSDLEVKYTGTKLMRNFKAFSILSFICFVIYTYANRKPSENLEN